MSTTDQYQTLAAADLDFLRTVCAPERVFKKLFFFLELFANFIFFFSCF